MHFWLWQSLKQSHISLFTLYIAYLRLKHKNEALDRVASGAQLSCTLTRGPWMYQMTRCTLCRASCGCVCLCVGTSGSHLSLSLGSSGQSSLSVLFYPPLLLRSQVHRHH